MRTIVKQEHYNNIEVEIEKFEKTVFGCKIRVFGRLNKFFDNEIIDIITSMKDDTRTIIVTDSAFEGFHAWYTKLTVSKIHENHNELEDYSHDDLVYEVKRLRTELEFLKQDVEMLKLYKLDSNKQSYSNCPYPQYPNVLYSWTHDPNGKDDIIF